MTISSTGGGRSRNLILTAMIFAVAMTFIDQTIVSIAAPTIERDLRNYGASLGFAILGTILISEFRSYVTSTLMANGMFRPVASAEAAKIAQLQGSNDNTTFIPGFIRADFAAATRDVLYGMAIVMAVAAVVALRGLRRGVQEATAPTGEEFSGEPTGEDQPADPLPG